MRIFLLFILALSFVAASPSFAAKHKSSARKKHSAHKVATQSKKKPKKLKRVEISFEGPGDTAPHAQQGSAAGSGPSTRIDNVALARSAPDSNSAIEEAAAAPVVYSKSVSIGGETIRYAPVQQRQRREVVFNEQSSKIFQRIIGLGGMNLSSAQGKKAETMEDPQNSNGPSGGALVDIGSRRLVIETGVLYRRMGFGNENVASRETPSVRANEYFTLDYVSLPISGKYYLELGRDFAFFGKVGVMASNLVQGQYEYYTYDRELVTHTIDGISDKEFGAQGGIGARLSLSGRFELLAEATYYRGLTPVFEKSDLFNSGFNFSGGLAYRL